MKIILKYLIFVQMGIIKNWYESVISRSHMINSFWLMETISQHMSIVITTATSNFRIEHMDNICRRSFKNAFSWTKHSFCILSQIQPNFCFKNLIRYLYICFIKWYISLKHFTIPWNNSIFVLWMQYMFMTSEGEILCGSPYNECLETNFPENSPSSHIGFGIYLLYM